MWLVFMKELKELTRDRKTLFFMIILPMLLIPVIIGVVGYFSSKAFQEAESKVLKYALVGDQYAAQVVQKFAGSPEFERLPIPAGADYADLIKTEQVDFVLVIPKSYSDDVLRQGQVALTLYLSEVGVNMVQNRVYGLLEEHEKVIQRRAFAALGLGETEQQGLLNPILIEKVDVADERESIGEAVGGLIPYMIFILCLQGAMFPATDLGAGEKERGTLETLLISPIDRHKLVLGKFLLIAMAGVTTALITVLSFALWGIGLSQGMAIAVVSDFMSSIGALDIVLMFLMLVPVVAIFAAVLLSLSIYARSFKEAQSYSGSLVVFVIVPIMIAAMPGIKLEGVWAWVPLTNVALAFKELIKGTMDYYQLIGIFGSTVLIAAALFAFCTYWFNREQVLFR